MVTPEQTARHVAQLIASRQKEAAERRANAWEVARDLAKRLQAEMGAQAVYAFGSLTKTWFHLRSDIDLAVTGLSAEQLANAWMRCDALAAPFHVDLVDLDRLPPSWRERVLAQGERL